MSDAWHGFVSAFLYRRSLKTLASDYLLQEIKNMGFTGIEANQF